MLRLTATLAAGGTWGALLGRVVARIWPLWFLLPGKASSWVWSPWLVAGLAVCAAVGALFLLAPLGRSRPENPIVRAWPLALAAPCLFRPIVDPLWGVGSLIAGAGGVAWLCRQGRPGSTSKAEWPWDVLAAALPLALYVSTLAPAVLSGDSGEFQVAATVLGIPHPTGYPLYLLLGKVFSLLPIRSVAYRLNLLSAVAAAAAVWAIYRAGRALGAGRAASLVGAALLGVSETLWSQATIAEKYALHAFLVALTLWLALRWRAERKAGRPGRAWLGAWALAYGLALAHHRTAILVAPAFLWNLWTTDHTALRGRSLLRLGALVLLPLSLYLLLPLFSALDPPYAYARLDSLRSFLDLVLARAYQGSLFRGGWAVLPGRLAEFRRLLVRQFGPLGLGLGVLGWGMLLKRDRQAAWMLALGMLAETVFALNYDVPNTFVYYLPAYVWLAACAAVAVDAGQRGIERLFSWWSRGAPAGRYSLGRSYLVLAWVMACAALPVHLCAARWVGMDQRRAYDQLPFDEAYGWLAARTLEPNALVISDWLPATVLWYTQFVEGLMPTAQVAVVDPLEGGWARLAGEALSAGRPAYLARPLVAAGDRYALTSAGPLVRVLDRLLLQPPPLSRPQNVDLEGGMRLLGCDLIAAPPGPEGARHLFAGTEVESGSTLHVTLYWQAVQAPASDYAVTVRLVDAAGRTWLERRSRHPVGGTYPTSRWQPGEVVGDYYELALPPFLPSGAYRLQAMMGDPFASSGLRDAQGDDELLLAAVQVHKPLWWPRAALSAPVRRVFGGGLLLTGYDAPGEVRPGETASVALQWLAYAPPAAAVHPDLVLVGGGGERAIEPLPVPAEDWQIGGLVVERYTFVVPDGLERVEVRGRQPVPFVSPVLRLPLRVTRAPPPVAYFGQQIRLLRYTYEGPPGLTGGTMHLTLEWEAVRGVSEPYKVFVHVLGEHGLPVAQQDNEPVNGTYPTTRWQAGERIVDPYAIPLPAAMAPGEYRVEVGLYRISDLGRLPVVDENGTVMDDKVFLAPLVVE